ncbi:17-beta-hydroxysteroid dehydrogenase 13-like [Musca vetustissima]|uniref:17-beta-hydroxysteroid dehydrogenase 13-like n=1 Tax=Musca vetustissima TaxID=27455 RepID=UPI002AB7BFF6|nr:17-beta-hydroxysteroid dehydrogenase 13-like [Musca vetustissima]
MFDKTARTNGIYWINLLVTILLFPILLWVSVIRWLFDRNPETEVKGEVAVITGGAQGLGRKLAIEFARRGCHIAVVDILEEKAQETAEYLKKTFKIKSKAYRVDITNHQKLVEFHSQVTRDFGDITIVVNNAGIVYFSDSAPRDFDEIQKIITVNFTSQVWINQLFLPRMKVLNRGHIMSISSLGALFNTAQLQIYGPAKSAVRAYMSSLRMDLNEYSGINVTTIMPTYMTTHQPTEQIVNSNGLGKFLPVLDGDYVAQEAVKALLQGVDEMTLPRQCIYGFKLQEFLSAWMRDKILLFLHPKIDLNAQQSKSK